MSRIKRSFFLTSLALIVGAAVSLTLFYRHVALKALIQITEADNEVLAYDTLKLLSPELENFMASVGDVKVVPAQHPLPASLVELIARLLRQKDVREINVYSRAGQVIYSTDPNDLGNDHATDPGVRAALAGKVANEFLYQEMFSRLDLTTARQNIVQSYVPIEHAGDTRVLGVFEIYSNVDDVVEVLERTELLVMLGGLLGFSVLAVAMFEVIRRAGAVIESEHAAVDSERRKLSRASLRVLHAEEKSREKISTGLQSGVVQSLSVIKMSIESAIAKAAQGKLTVHDQALDTVIPVMHEVIESLSSLAADLHPASLQDLGLLPALGRVCDEFQRAHRSIIIEFAIQVAESDVPQNLKITIYRTVQTILEDAGRHGGHDRVDVSLSVRQQELRLRIELGRSGNYKEPDSPAVERAGARLDLEMAGERVILSGGAFSAQAHGIGDVGILATWPLEPGQTEAVGGKPEGQNVVN